MPVDHDSTATQIHVNDEGFLTDPAEWERGPGPTARRRRSGSS